MVSGFLNWITLISRTFYYPTKRCGILTWGDPTSVGLSHLGRSGRLKRCGIAENVDIVETPRRGVSTE